MDKHIKDIEDGALSGELESNRIMDIWDKISSKTSLALAGLIIASV